MSSTGKHSQISVNTQTEEEISSGSIQSESGDSHLDGSLSIGYGSDASFYFPSPPPFL